MGKLARAFLPVLLALPSYAQNFSQRGFLEADLTLYAETAPNDSSHAIDDNLFRYEASYKALPWLRLAGSFDARFDTHLQTERAVHLDWQDRSLLRPALLLREFNATITRGKLTAEFGISRPFPFAVRHLPGAKVANSGAPLQQSSLPPDSATMARGHTAAAARSIAPVVAPPTSRAQCCPPPRY